MTTDEYTPLSQTKPRRWLTVVGPAPRADVVVRIHIVIKSWAVNVAVVYVFVRSLVLLRVLVFL